MSVMPANAGRLYGVGVGPGDPDLVTLKAARIIAAADVVAYPVARRATGRGVARARCAHSLAVAVGRGFRATPWNFVVSTNGQVNVCPPDGANTAAMADVAAVAVNAPAAAYPRVRGPASRNTPHRASATRIAL